jgi:aconitate hydratase 2/2-methylisocitrate dehydratase
MLAQYREEAARRAAAGVPPLPLSADQTRELTRLLTGGHPEQETLLDLLAERVEPGVSRAAEVKAAWLEQVAVGAVRVAGFKPEAAIAMLAQMGGGYNVAALIRLLDNEQLAPAAADGLRHLTKIYEAFDEVASLAAHHPAARSVLESWAAAEWFTAAAEVPERIVCTVYKVDGEINTDDFSPGNQAQSRADIPLHATFFGRSRFPGGLAAIAAFRREGKTVAFAGDVVGTGSSRKSAINSLSWLIGADIPHVPNKRSGGIVLGGIIAPIFYATARDAGVLPAELDAHRPGWRADPGGAAANHPARRIPGRWPAQPDHRPQPDQGRLPDPGPSGTGPVPRDHQSGTCTRASLHPGPENDRPRL